MGSGGEQFGVCGGVLGVIWGLTQSPPLPSLRMKSAPHAEPPPSGAEEPDLERLKQVLGGVRGGLQEEAYGGGRAWGGGDMNVGDPPLHNPIPVQELLEEVRRELQKMKEEIVEGEEGGGKKGGGHEKMGVGGMGVSLAKGRGL